MLRSIVLIFVGVCMLCSTSFAQESTNQPTKSSDVSISDTGKVSLDFRDADIKNVLQILSFKSGVNIVASPEVTGTISIQLNDVPWQQALDVILKTYGYASEREGNVIVVTTIENMKKRREDAMLLAEQEPLVTQTFTINFGKASEIIESIDKMRSERGSINYDERTNMLIVTDISKNINLMSGVIEQLDTTTPQVLIESKIVETTFVDSENLGIDWVTKATISGSERPITWPFTTATNSKYTPDNFPGAATADFTYGTLNFSQVQAVFELLKSRSNTNILSNPRIVTLDNKSAQITVGSQYPIPTYTYNEEQARLQVSGWEYMDIGIIFDVLPHVNSAGFVTLEVEPKITAILDFVTVENTSLPRLSNESSKTNVMIKDGETLVIAGLVKNQTTDIKKKTPFLGDIPVLGYAFQKTEKSVNKTDLLIFITPHIVTPELASGT
ncbi:MAG: type IV pilus secretin PilQ [Candidatus Omnitrophica bacterium]|nr:type IV pilus secretin PilQ [Candidatus Omnitrophota bacterium]